MEAYENCDICLNPVRFYSLGPCNHRDQCTECYLRRKTLYNQIDCPVCRQPIEQAIFTNDKEKRYQDFDLTDWFHDVEKGMYMDVESGTDYRTFSRLWKIKCPYCDSEDFDGVDSLKKHTKATHRLEFCEVSLADRKVYLQEQKLYSARDLKTHLKT